MRRPAGRTNATGSSGKKSGSSGSALSPLAVEAIERFVGVLAQCGGLPPDLLAVFKVACQRIPPKTVADAKQLIPEMSDASHVLTLWYSDPNYTDGRGDPLPLKIKGAPPSLEDLVQRVNSDLRVEELLRYLLRVQALQKKGTLVVPRGRSIELRGTGGPTHFRNLRALTAMLRTLEHNSKPEPLASSWFEVFAENPRFPRSAQTAFDARLRRRGLEFLQDIDADMHRRELARKPGERCVRIGVGIYRFEEDVGPDAGPDAVSGTLRRPNRRRRGST